MFSVFIKTFYVPMLVFFVMGGPTVLVASAKKTGFFEERSEISLGVRFLSSSEARNLFKCYNPVKIIHLTHYYKILEITVENKTDQDFVLAQNNIDLKLEHSLVIREKIKNNPVLVPFFTTVGVTALLISGIGFAVVPSVIAGLTCGVTALNVSMHSSSHISTETIRNKVLDPVHPVAIPSFSKMQKIVFVAAKNVKNNFVVTLESIDGMQKEAFLVMMQ